MGARVEAIDLWHSYGEGWVLKGVSLRANCGEFVCIRGPSGAGKTTLLSILGLLIRPVRGEVWIEGERVDNLGGGRRAELRRRDIGFVFQLHNLVPRGTGWAASRTGSPTP